MEMTGQEGNPPPSRGTFESLNQSLSGDSGRRIELHNVDHLDDD
jgi:hypothetical protein